MSLPPPPGFGYITFGFQGSGIAQFNTWAFANPLSFTAANIRTNLESASRGTGSIYDDVNYYNLSRMVSSYVLVNIGGLLYSDQANVSYSGSASFNPVPPGTSGVVHKNTALAGRQYRGRVALPSYFLDETAVASNGGINAPVVAALQASLNQWQSDMSGYGTPAVILHGPPLVGATPAPTAVTSFEMTALVGSQRRRLRR